MDYAKFIKPREVVLDGETYAISQIPALEAQEIYREVAKSYSEHGPIGFTMLSQGAVRAILAYVAARVDDNWFSLDTETRINGYLQGKKAVQARLLVLMIKENWGFLTDGSLLDVLGLEGAKESES